jgi:acetyl esterase/lipase
MKFPESIFPFLLRATGANKPYISAEGAEVRIRELQNRPVPFHPPKNLHPNVTVTLRRLVTTPVYTVTPATSRPTGHVIYAHGGGYVHEISPHHWKLIAQIAADANTTVTVPIYELLPYGNAECTNALIVELFNAAKVEQANVSLAGDSAGGQIALSAAITLRDQGHSGIRTVLISPLLDLTLSNPEIAAVVPHDPWLGVEGLRALGMRWAGNLSMNDPKASPLMGDLHDLGPMFILTGTHDILNPDARLLASKAKAASTDVNLLERRNAIHVFPLLPTRSVAPARALICDALRV